MLHADSSNLHDCLQQSDTSCRVASATLRIHYCQWYRHTMSVQMYVNVHVHTLEHKRSWWLHIQQNPKRGQEKTKTRVQPQTSTIYAIQLKNHNTICSMPTAVYSSPFPLLLTVERNGNTACTKPVSLIPKILLIIKKWKRKLRQQELVIANQASPGRLEYSS